MSIYLLYPPGIINRLCLFLSLRLYSCSVYLILIQKPLHSSCNQLNKYHSTIPPQVYHCTFPFCLHLPQWFDYHYFVKCSEISHVLYSYETMISRILHGSPATSTRNSSRKRSSLTILSGYGLQCYQSSSLRILISFTT